MTDRIPVSSFQKHDAVHSLNCYWAKDWFVDFGMGVKLRAQITETEAYLGSDDLASHASKPGNFKVARCTY